ncbi:hypothetical protein SDC9_131133 [bioreactor metagenome]|uniref:Uncharacterized protein n=1 Tax=bioreactor metagenome TaxID=1076179 RepID=A0A645D5Z4_9ZZZZ
MPHLMKYSRLNSSVSCSVSLVISVSTWPELNSNFTTRMTDPSMVTVVSHPSGSASISPLNLVLQRMRYVIPIFSNSCMRAMEGYPLSKVNMLFLSPGRNFSYRFIWETAQDRSLYSDEKAASIRRLLLMSYRQEARAVGEEAFAPMQKYFSLSSGRLGRAILVPSTARYVHPSSLRAGSLPIKP